jgi:hypothetical protein
MVIAELQTAFFGMPLSGVGTGLMNSTFDDSTEKERELTSSIRAMDMRPKDRLSQIKRRVINNRFVFGNLDMNAIPVFGTWILLRVNEPQWIPFLVIEYCWAMDNLRHNRP